MALVIKPGLREHAPQMDLSGLGLAPGLLARASNQLLRTHRDAGAIGTDIEHRHRTRFAWRRYDFPLRPSRGVGADPLHHALDLPRGPANAAGLGPVQNSAFW